MTTLFAQAPPHCLNSHKCWILEIIPLWCHRWLPHLCSRTWCEPHSLTRHCFSSPLNMWKDQESIRLCVWCDVALIYHHYTANKSLWNYFRLQSSANLVTFKRHFVHPLSCLVHSAIPGTKAVSSREETILFHKGKSKRMREKKEAFSYGWFLNEASLVPMSLFSS